jgi:hypothetical protein
MFGWWSFVRRKRSNRLSWWLWPGFRTRKTGPKIDFPTTFAAAARGHAVRREEQIVAGAAGRHGRNGSEQTQYTHHIHTCKRIHLTPYTLGIHSPPHETNQHYHRRARAQAGSKESGEGRHESFSTGTQASPRVRSHADEMTSRPERRRALRTLRKKAKHARQQPIPDPAGNRATRRANLRHVHKQDRMKGDGWTRENLDRAKARRKSAKRRRRLVRRKASHSPTSV